MYHWFAPAGMLLAKKLGQAIGNYFESKSSDGGIPVLTSGLFGDIRWVAVRPEHFLTVMAAHPGAVGGADYMRYVERLWDTDPRKARRLQPLTDELMEVYERSGRACCFVLVEG